MKTQSKDYNVYMIPIEMVDRELEKIYNDPTAKIISKEKVSIRRDRDLEEVYYLVVVKRKKQTAGFYP